MTQNFCEHALFKRLPQPLYAPHISPSGFYLFGKVKGGLIGQQIPDEIGLRDAVIEIVDGITSDELRAVCRNWIEHVQSVIDADGGYVSR
jgi:hypothetical protein